MSTPGVYMGVAPPRSSRRISACVLREGPPARRAPGPKLARREAESASCLATEVRPRADGRDMVLRPVAELARRRPQALPSLLGDGVVDRVLEQPGVDEPTLRARAASLRPRRSLRAPRHPRRKLGLLLRRQEEFSHKDLPIDQPGCARNGSRSPNAPSGDPRTFMLPSPLRRSKLAPAGPLRAVAGPSPPPKSPLSM